MPEFPSLYAFARWFLSQPLSALRPPAAGVQTFENSIVHGIVLYRRPPFQCELFSIDGAHRVVPHRHPNVQSIEYFLCASGGEGVSVFTSGQRFDTALEPLAPDGASLICGRRVRVRPGELHGATLRGARVAFLSMQEWLNGVPPTSIGLDWEGSSQKVIL